MSDLVGNPEDRFSRVEAHFILSFTEFLELLAKLQIGRGIAHSLTGGHSHGGHSHRRRRAIDPKTLTNEEKWVRLI